MSLNILIIGATSGIAEAVARRYAEQGAKLFLIARNSVKLQTVVVDLQARGALAVNNFVLDANRTSDIPKALDEAWKILGQIDIALVAHGSLPDQKRSEADVTYAIDEFRTNAESVIAYLIELAQRFESQGKGIIAVIGSVAGDRGRPSNYLYGAAKAAINAYASGLRARLCKKGVHILTIKPGLVATTMTRHLDLPAKLMAMPESVAQEICKAIECRRNVLYTPRFWVFIMFVVRILPTSIFKRINL